jgi:hypothetical protein
MRAGLWSFLLVAGGASAAQLAVACCCCCPKTPPATASAPPPVAAPASNSLGATPPAATVAVKSCPAGLRPAADGLIDDLEDNDNRVQQLAGRGGYWWSAKDDKGSTIEPLGEMKMTAGGAHGSKYAVHVTGKTASGEGAWGSVFGLRLAPNGLYDASKYAGISFFAKAGQNSASAVRLKVADVNTHPDGNVCKDGCYNDFGKDFSLSKDWQEYQVSFAELKQQDGWGDPRPPSVTPAKLVQIAWHLSTPGAAFEIWLDDVHLLDCQ